LRRGHAFWTFVQISPNLRKNLFLALASSLKAASMEIAAAKLGPAAGMEVGGRGPLGGAGVGVLGAAGIVQGGSAGFGVAEELTAPQDDRTGTG
jgi:hypothetical protein